MYDWVYVHVLSDILQEPIDRFERTRLILQVGFVWTCWAGVIL